VDSEPPHPSTVPMEDEVETYWGRRWGSTSEIGKLRTVMVHRPGDELKAIDDPIRWLWIGKPNISKAQQEHDAMVKALRDEGVEVLSLERSVGDRAKMYFMRDQAAVIKSGVILSRMALGIRKGEERFVASRLGELGVPILRTIHGKGIFEGGNFMFLDAETVLIGTGVRTNREGVRQAAEVLTTQGVKSVVPVPQAAYLHTFPSGYVHLDVAFNIIDTGLVILYPEGVPYDLVELLRERKMRIIEVVREEALKMSTNFLVLEPSKVMTASGNQKTKKALEKENVEVIEVEVSELMKGGGSIRCMTIPLVRDEIRSRE
jgi:N-dimethylarginine dimethylaminohydrolase